MGFKEAVKTCFQKYITFSGRASRSEFWWCHSLTIVPFVLMIAVRAFGFNIPNKPFEALYSMYTWVFLLPNISVMARRMHDINRSGWWVLFFTLAIWVPFVFAIAFGWGGSGFLEVIGFFAISLIMASLMLFWLCRKGTEANNRFGPDPMQEIHAKNQ